jgi:pseudouridine kinase
MGKILVIGSANVDLIGVGTDNLKARDSNIGRIDLWVGGVGKNIAENLKLLRCDLGFLTFLGNDPFAKVVSDHLDRLGIDYSKSIWMDHPSGKYLAIHQPDGSLELGMNDLALVELADPKEIEARFDYIDTFDTLVFDTNLSQVILDSLFARFAGKRIIVDGVSQTKVLRIKKHLLSISLLKMNSRELASLLGKPSDDIILQVRELIACGLKQVIVTNGPEPITYNIERRIYQTAVFDPKYVRSSVGCGDALLSGTIYGLVNGKTMHESLNCGKKAAALTMEVYSPCNPALCPELLED